MSGFSGYANSQNLRRSERGYTLVELLVSITILSIALIGIMSAFNASHVTQDRAVNMAIARDIAITETERFRAMQASVIPTSTPATSSPNLPRGNQITRTASKYPDTSQNRLWRVIVTVTWPEGASSRSITYDTLFYKP